VSTGTGNLNEQLDHSDKPSKSRRDRRRALKKGTISNHDSTISYDCVVSNISETGAKVKFTDPILLPSRIWLHVELGGFKVECKKVWHRGLEMGVKFVGEKIQVTATRVHVLKPIYDTKGSELDNGHKIEEQVRIEESARHTSTRANRVGPIFGKRR